MISSACLEGGRGDGVRRLFKKDFKFHRKSATCLRLQSPLILYGRTRIREQIFKPFDVALQILNVLPEQMAEFRVDCNRHALPPRMHVAIGLPRVSINFETKEVSCFQGGSAVMGRK